jgi:small conductance mechanosensitive channel
MTSSICIRSGPRPRAGMATLAWLMVAAMPLLAAETEKHGPLDKPPEVLAMHVQHLGADELQAEADRWLARLQDTVRRLNEVKVEIWRENQALQAAEADVAEKEQAARSPADQAERPDPEVVRETERKEASLERLAALREERVQVIDRFNVVVDEFSVKLGTTDTGQEKDEVLAYRRYIDSVKAVEVDTSDFQALRSTAASWLVSPEGGQRMANNVGKFLAIVAGFWLLSRVLGRLARKAMSLAHGASQILSRFVVNTIRRVTIIVGLLLGLSALEINVTPLVAVIGAAGFVIAFALQNTLSNFASGLMIMFYKPFDIGDFVQTSEVMGTVRSMTLVTTNMMTPDNKLLVVPNNELWGKVITNVTGSSERRVDLVFGIGYGDDIALAERVLREVVEAHPAVLAEPEPVIAVSELADSSVNLVCRPWVKTPDYWPVYWEITRAVKERFDAEGISIPFPQRDVYVHTAAAPAGGVVE